MQDHWSAAGRDPDGWGDGDGTPGGSGWSEANQLDINRFDEAKFDLERFHQHRSSASLDDSVGRHRIDDVTESWRRSSPARRAWLLGSVAAVVALLLGGAATVMLIGGDAARPALANSTTTPASPSADESLVQPFRAEEDPPATVRAASSPSRSPKARAMPSRWPANDPLPPAPPTATPPPVNCYTITGPPAPRPDVRAQLEVASKRAFWATDVPALRVPLSLLMAVGWQESGWQSTIISCDGGIGVMQLMPNTAEWANERFGTSWDVMTLSGNAMLGGQYLAWLIRYMGDVFYDGLYDVTKDDGLLNSVVSAYNAGYRAVDPTKGRAGIPNWTYVDNVRALMRSCPCSQY